MNRSTILESFEKEWYTLNGTLNDPIIRNAIKQEQDSRSVIARNISDQTTKEELFDLFSKYGTVLLVTIIPNTPSNEALIEFDSSDPTDKVIELTGFELHQKHLLRINIHLKYHKLNLSH